MKKRILVILGQILTLSTFSLNGMAQHLENGKKLPSTEILKIQWALKVLSDNNVLIQKNNACLDFNPDVLKMLEDEGSIEKGKGPSIQTICGQPPM